MATSHSNDIESDSESSSSASSASSPDVNIAYYRSTLIRKLDEEYGVDTSNLSDQSIYELERLCRIQRNQKILNSLGVVGTTTKETKKRVVKPKNISPSPPIAPRSTPRRSSAKNDDSNAQNTAYGLLYDELKKQGWRSLSNRVGGYDLVMPGYKIDDAGKFKVVSCIDMIQANI